MSELEMMNYEPLKEPMAIGQVFAASGMFPDVKSQAQACVKILAGKELGLSAFESMASIYIVGGKLALTSKAMSGLIKRSKVYDYVIKKLDETECTIAIIKGETELGVSTFTIKDAAKAGIVNGVNWQKYPKNMLFARAISNAARFYCPDAISGYYTTEELEDVVEIAQPVKTSVSVTIPDSEVVDGKAGI